MTLFNSWYARNKNNSLEWLHDIHRHAEIGGEKVITAAFVAGQLEKLGFDVATGIGGTGVVGSLLGERSSVESPGRVIGFRAELNALLMQEQADVEYKSQTDGRFHGCGHEGHSVTCTGV